MTCSPQNNVYFVLVTRLRFGQVPAELSDWKGLTSAFQTLPLCQVITA